MRILGVAQVGVVAVLFQVALLGGAAQAALAPLDNGGISQDPSRATYKDVKAFMRALSEQNPQSASLFTLGESDNGDEIQGLAIGNGPVHNLVVASHHGNEYGSVEVARGLAVSLAQHPIQGQTVYVIPVLNLRGYDTKARREPANGRSWDPNRNYPGPCGTEGPFTLKSTRALAEFVDKQGIVASATMHTFYPAVLYPWGVSTHDFSTPYDDLFKLLVAAATVESQYQVGNSTEVLYPADGAFEDYVFWQHGVWSLLFELGQTHSPSLKQVQKMVEINVPGLRRFLEQAPTTRAESHDFSGQCDRSWAMRSRDRHDE